MIDEKLQIFHLKSKSIKKEVLGGDESMIYLLETNLLLRFLKIRSL